jgi:hypothetical protein
MMRIYPLKYYVQEVVCKIMLISYYCPNIESCGEKISFQKKSTTVGDRSPRALLVGVQIGLLVLCHGQDRSPRALLVGAQIGLLVLCHGQARSSTPATREQGKVVQKW